MPTLEITEYGDDVGAGLGPQLNWQQATIGNVPVQVALGGDTRTVVVLADGDCRIAIGGNAVATNAGAVKARLLKQGVEARLSVRRGERLSVLTNDTMLGSYTKMTISGAPAPAAQASSATFTPPVTGGTPPYTLTLRDYRTPPPPGRAVSGGSIGGSYDKRGDYSYAVRARDSVGQVVDLIVEETVAAATLGALTLSAAIRAGQAATGTISGATAGSRIDSYLDGMKVNSDKRTFAWDGSGDAGNYADALIETPANGGPGRSTTLTVARGAGVVPPVMASIGGVAIGTVAIVAGQSNMVLADGQEFGALPLSQLLLSGERTGLYATQPGAYRRQNPSNARYASGLAGYNVDPFHGGWLNSNKGAPVASFADSITQDGSAILLNQRQATAAEKTHFADASAATIQTMISSVAALCAKAPFVWESYIRINTGQFTHCTDWWIQKGRFSNGRFLEIDVESARAGGSGDGRNINFNDNGWTPDKDATHTWGGMAFGSADYHKVQLVVRSDGGREYWVDDVLRAQDNPAYYRSEVLDKAFVSLYTAHAYAADGGSINGTNLFQIAWERIWVPNTASPLIKPSVQDVNIDVAFDTAFSQVLASKATLWGDGSVTDVLEAIPLEGNEPTAMNGINNFGTQTLLGPQFAYDPATFTLSGQVRDNAGRKLITRHVEASGKVSRINRIFVNVGPRIALPQNTPIKPGTTLDLWRYVDFGVLTTVNGAPAVSFAMTGLPSGVTLNGATGALTVAAGTADQSFSTTLTVANSRGQQASATRTLRIAAANSYRDWADFIYDAGTDLIMRDGSETPIYVLPRKGDATNLLTRNGASANGLRQKAAKNSQDIVRTTRTDGTSGTAANVYRLVANAAAPVSQVMQGEDRAVTIIMAMKPNGANAFFPFGWTHSLDASNSEGAFFTRRSASASGLTKRTTTANTVAVTFGSGDPAGDVVYAVRFNGTTVDVWRLGAAGTIERLATAAAQDLPAISASARFQLFSIFDVGTSDTPSGPNESVDWYETVIAGSARSDAEITAAMLDIADQWGIAHA